MSRWMVGRVTAALLVSASVPVVADAARADPAPTLATDPQTGTTALTGPHHLDGAAFSLILTDWWLTGAVGSGQAPEVRLIVEVYLPTYPLLDRATDAGGHKLDVVILNRGPSPRYPKKASERVAILLPRELAEGARTTGLAITVSGKDRSFPITVPADALGDFLDAYARVAGNADAAPAPPAQAPAAPVVLPPATPDPAAVPPVSAPPVAKLPPARATTPQLNPSAPTLAATSDDDDPAITPVPDRRLRLPDGQFVGTPSPAAAAPHATAAPAPTPANNDAPASDESAGGDGLWIDSIGVQFVATSSGAMILAVRPGSVAASKGIESADFIEAVDGTPIKGLDGAQMAARIGAPGVKVLHMIAAGDIRLR